MLLQNAASEDSVNGRLNRRSVEDVETKSHKTIVTKLPTRLNHQNSLSRIFLNISATRKKTIYVAFKNGYICPGINVRRI